MDCDRIRDDLGRREAGLLDAAGAEDVNRHLAACGGCRTYSDRMRTLVSVLEEYPEIRELPRRRLPRSRLAALAAALLAALAVPAVGPLIGPRTVLEGGFDSSHGTVTATDASSALVVHGHRMRCRKGTRVRLVGAREVFLEQGRLDVSGLREGASGLKIGTPLGLVEVVGTRFVVEVTPVNKSQAAVAAGSFVVGVMVSSGVVTYADHRLAAGQGIVEETGKAPRRISAAAQDGRLRTALDRERELETRIAALGIEKDRLRADLAALERGETPAPRIPLSPDQRRDRVRKLAQVLVKSYFNGRATVVKETMPLDEKELRRLAEQGGSHEVEHEVLTHVDIDGKSMSEALTLSSELGMNFFEPTSFLEKGEMVEELMMAVLEARATTASTLRPAVEGAVRSAYGSLAGPWESKSDERLDQTRAVQRALAQLEGSLGADQIQDLYEMGRSIVSIPEYAVIPYAPASWRTQWVDRLAKEMELDAASRPILEAAADETIGRLGKIPGHLGGGSKKDFEYLLRCREAGADLVRQLSARFPDRKEKIDLAVNPR